jgi:adenylate kinase family enzyme
MEIQPTSNVSLAQVIDDVLFLAVPPGKPYETLQLPPGQVKLCVLGKPFSGKSQLAAKLATDYKLAALEMDELIKDALKSHEGTKPNTPKAPKESIGVKLQQAMLEGKSPDDTILISLVTQAIKNVDPALSGWVLVDFPRNRKQALLLEKELTGWVHTQVLQFFALY